MGPCCAGLDLQAQVQPLLPAYSYLCDVIQRGTTALLKVRLHLPARRSAQMRAGVAGSCCVQSLLNLVLHMLACTVALNTCTHLPVIHLITSLKQSTAVCVLMLQGLRVYEQGRLLSAWQDRLSDAIQAQLAALFSSACSSFLRLAGVKVCLRNISQHHHKHKAALTCILWEPVKCFLLLICPCHGSEGERIVLLSCCLFTGGE